MKDNELTSNDMYDEIHENRRVIRTEKSAYSINLDRSSGLWSIKPEEGILPKALEGRYTTPANAAIAIKNYLDSRPRKGQ